MNSAGLLPQLMAASWQLSIGAVAIWLLARRLSGNHRAWLWRAVAMKTCVALFFIAPIAWLAADSSAIPLGLAPTMGSETGIDQVGRPSPDGRKLASSPLPSDPAPGFDVDTACLVAWAAGLIAGLGILAVRIHRGERFVRQVKAAAPADAQCGHQVVRTNSTGAPLILGIWRPTILLPADSDSPLPLAHELAHADRHDLRWDVAMSLFRTLFWFHPLAWLAVYEHRQACEEASDALAIARTGASPTDYGRALLAYASQPILPMTALASSATTLRRRLQQMHCRLPHPAIALTIIAASLACLIPARLTAAETGPRIPTAPSIDERASNLILRPAIKKEIGLSGAQAAAIQKALDTNYSDIGRIARTMAKMKEDGVPDKQRVDWENREKDALWAKNAKDSLSILSESQRKRLREIALQSAGPMALGEEAIGEQAGLPQAKIRQIADLAAEAQKASMRLSVRKAHEDMERFRKGQNLSGSQRSRYLYLDRKSRRVWQYPEFRKYDASLKLKEGDPKRIAAGKEFRAWMATNPNRMTPEEEKEYFELSKLASKDPTRQARDQRYARLYTEMFARYNVQSLQLLTPTERQAWNGLLGKAVAWR